jgi:hypothetical protein
MAGCSCGPVSTLPGALRKPPKDMACDDHPDRLAVMRVQGETDSYGAEYLDMCQACFEAYQAAPKDSEGTCAWCKTHQVTLRPYRDGDEGVCGPVYEVCEGCRKKDAARWAAELQEMEEEHDAALWNLDHPVEEPFEFEEGPDVEIDPLDLEDLRPEDDDG